MRFLGWVQTKIIGKREKFDASNGFAQYSPRQNSCKEEFKDWPQAVLAIGTFGRNEVPDDEKPVSETSESLQENKDLCIEEVIRLQNEISKLLNLKPSFSTEAAEVNTEHTPLKIYNGEEITLNKSKYRIADKHSMIRQKSLSFLLKKLFVLRNGNGLHSNIKDPISESRMEKILRKIIHFHPQATARATSIKYLERNNEEEKRENGGKWVKTDSEYIVLEI